MKSKKMKLFNLLFAFILLLAITAYSQKAAPIRIAVLPFQNMDGLIERNIWSYQLQDTIYDMLLAEDPNKESYYLVPIDSIEILLADMNIDPTNPQYPSDMWKAVDMLKAEQVVTGNFDFHGGKFLINAYIYDTEMRLPLTRHQARDIFKDPDSIMEAAPLIIKRLLPGLKKK